MKYAWEGRAEHELAAVENEILIRIDLGSEGVKLKATRNRTQAQHAGRGVKVDGTGSIHRGRVRD